MPTSFVFGDYTLDLKRYELRCTDQRASITASATPVPAVPGKSTVAPAEKGVAGLSQTLNSPDQSVSRYDFFIAYATPDRRLAQDLCWFLQDDACEVFLDVQDLSPGAVWLPALREALEASRAIVVLVSTHTNDAFYQQEEIVRAIQLARDKPNAHTVIPVVLEKLPQGAVSMPYGMSSLQAQDATRSGGLKRVATELVSWLKDHQRNTKQPQMADAMIEADQRIRLQPLQFKMLRYLIQHRDRVVSIEELIETVWEGQMVGNDTVNACLWHVRAAVGDSARTQHTIQTLPRLGYRFVADVEERSARGAAPLPDTGQTTVDDTARLGPVRAARLGNAPPLPALVIGREAALDALKARLEPSSGAPRTQVLTAVQGWPGVGKTTMAAVLAHDPAIVLAFPDGVLWTSLGPTPGLLSALGIGQK